MKISFIQPMLFRQPKLTGGRVGYTKSSSMGSGPLPSRAMAKSTFAPRNDKDFNGKYAAIVKALGAIPEDSVIDVALVEAGRPSFSAIQNYGSSTTPVLRLRRDGSRRC